MVVVMMVMRVVVIGSNGGRGDVDTDRGLGGDNCGDGCGLWL